MKRKLSLDAPLGGCILVNWCKKQYLCAVRKAFRFVEPVTQILCYKRLTIAVSERIRPSPHSLSLPSDKRTIPFKRLLLACKSRKAFSPNLCR